MKSKIDLRKAQIVGTPSDTIWSQSFVFEAEEPAEKEKNDVLFGVMVVATEEGKEATVVGNEILARMQGEYRKEYNGKNLDKLKNILAGELEKRNGYTIEISLALLKDPVLYLTANIGGGIIIKREENYVPFFELAKGDEVRTASGLINNKDILILKTQGFSQNISNEKLQGLFKTNQINEITDILAPEVHNSEESSGSACIIVEISKYEIADEIEEENEVVFSEPLESSRPETPVKEVAVSPLKKITAKIQSLFPKKKDHQEISLQLRNEEEKPGKMLRLAAVGIFFILMIIIAGSVINNKNVQQKNQFAKSVEVIKGQISEGSALSDLNPNKAKSLVNQAKDNLSLLQKSVKPKSPEEETVKMLTSQINDLTEKVSKIYKITPSLFYDLTIVKDNALGSEISRFGNNLVILDNKNNAVYFLNTEKKNGEIIAGGKDIQGVKLVSFYGSNAYLLNPDKNILKVDISSKQSKELIKKDKWGEIKDFVSFAGNLYLLDAKNNQIWKYIATDASFSAVNAYLTADTVPDLSKALSMAIDGSVYVLKNDGVIVKFTQGRSDNFIVNGLDQQLEAGAKIFGSDETKNIYVLDKGNKRVVVLTKDGNYLAQYTGGDIGNAADFVVDESAKTIYLLSGNKILTFSLK